MNNVIKVIDLVKKYGDVIAVDGISFSVRKGEIFSLLGPNGAGKTTTIEIIEGIRDATSGEVRIFGMKPGDVKVREKMGVLPQEFSSIERLTVMETICYFASMYDEHKDCDELLKMLGLYEKRNELYKNLSGGMKRRTGIAIALVNNPELIFLDEPTTGLDPAARKSLWDIIEYMKEEKKTVILTTHYMEEAEKLADRIAIMNDGKIIAEGTPDELIDKYGGKKKIIIDAKEKIVREISDEKEIVEIINKLKEEGIDYRFIEIKRPSMDDVFINLTGRKINEN